LIAEELPAKRFLLDLQNDCVRKRRGVDQHHLQELKAMLAAVLALIASAKWIYQDTCKTGAALGSHIPLVVLFAACLFAQS